MYVNRNLIGDNKQMKQDILQKKNYSKPAFKGRSIAININIVVVVVKNRFITSVLKKVAVGNSATTF